MYKDLEPHGFPAPSRDALFMKKVASIILLQILSWGFVTQADALTLDVEITGVDAKQQANLAAYLDILKHQHRPGLNQRLVKKYYARIESQVRQALQPFGYYRPVIHASLNRQGETWKIRIQIDPGPAVLLQEVDVQIEGPARDDPVLQAWRTKIPLQQGTVLRHAEYEQTKQQLINLARQRGYFDARYLRHEVRVDLDVYVARIHLHLASGPRYRFGPVLFRQSPAPRLDDAFLKRFLSFRSGEPYEAEKLTRTRQQLVDSGYFRAVDIELQREAVVQDRVPILVNLQLTPSSRYRLGIGYGTDTGARGSLIMNRQLNRKGHWLDAEARLADRRDSARLGYRIPLARPWQEQLGFTLRYEDETTDTSSSTIKALGVERSRVRRHWLETLALEYVQEDYTVGKDRGSSDLLVFSSGWSRTVARNRIFTRNGYRLNTNLSGAATGLGSDVSYLQGLVSGKWIRSFGKRNRGIVRGEVGYTDIAQFDQLPASKRFFAGGDQSVRGYDYETLGPTDANGVVIGGKHLLVGSVELEHFVSDKWSAAVFYDMGNAVNDFSEPLKRGAGVGLRWRSPIGPVRLDLAYALSEPDTPWRVHVVIGPDL